MANWKPLEARLPVEECAAFMYMGNEGDVHLYKHIESRRYLCLDEKSNCFVEDGESGRYVPADFSAEYAHAKDGQQANAFEAALSEALRPSAPEAAPEPGKGMER